MATKDEILRLNEKSLKRAINESRFKDLNERNELNEWTEFENEDDIINANTVLEV